MATTAANLRASGVRHRTTYDVMDRPWRTETIGPARVHSASTDSLFRVSPTPRERLVVIATYNAEGAPATVSRQAFIEGGAAEEFTTTYEYDRAGRRRVETGSQSGEQRFTYDASGNLTVARTANGFDVTMQYDALGRLTRRTVPQRTHAKTCHESSVILGCEPYPRFPNQGDGYGIAEEWHHYRYDGAGNQVVAENADAIVARSYYPNGALKTDSTYIRPAQGMTYEAYGMHYTYDPAGRVTALEHPANLTGATGSTDRFFYHPVTGALLTGRSRQGYDFTFHHDDAGRLTSLRLPGAIVDSMRYDLEGRLVWREEKGPSSGVLHAETMEYDARGKLLMAYNGGSVFQNWYSGAGNLVGTDWRGLSANVARISEELQLDPLGNVHLRRTSQGADQQSGELPRFENLNLPGTGRLFYTRNLPPAIPSSSGQRRLAGPSQRGSLTSSAISSSSPASSPASRPSRRGGCTSR
jgi:YD repeat-containing protein